MFSLSYKTRGGKYPNRKPRVFFCSHPKDFYLLDHISEQLLEKVDCSVWYMQNEPVSAEEIQALFADLADMQLFVVPVTSAFLNSRCYASQQLIPFFQEKKIPFLPLMQEEGLGELFTKEYGSLQYLSEYDKSPGALPFSLKLENYLQRVLMNMSIDSFQNAFRAQIFVSYRKKDRNYARSVMKVIHKKSELEDVAVWYDEYLVPGEDFHDSIADAIYECDAFLMVVTPNLVKERNYIETKEYPYAKNAAKFIIPCEVQRTSHMELENRYKDIPACIDVKELSGYLSKLLNRYPSVYNTSAQAKYRIGCAYLSGINVEVDREHGMSLIQEAAKSECKDAMQFMCWAYRYGNGVECDAEKAFAWQKRLVQLCADLTAKAPDRLAVCELISQSIELGTILQSMGKYKEGIAWYKKAQEFIKEYEWGLSKYETIFLTLSLLIKNAASFLLLSRFDESIDSCKSILHLVNNLAVEYKDYQILRIEMQAYEKLGTIRFIQKDFVSALDYYQNCYKIARNSFDQAADDKLFFYKTGETTEFMGRIDGDVYLLSMDSMDHIMLLCQKDYAVACTKVGDVYFETGSVDEAMKFYRMAKEILDHLIETGIDVNPVWREIGLIYRKMADIYAYNAQYEKALEKMREACKTGEYILQTNHSSQYQRDLAVYYYQIGQLYEKMRRKPYAQMYFEKALEIVNKQNPTPQITDFKKQICVAIKRCKRRWPF